MGASDFFNPLNFQIQVKYQVKDAKSCNVCVRAALEGRSMAVLPQARQRSGLREDQGLRGLRARVRVLIIYSTAIFLKGLKFNYSLSKPHQQYSLQYWLC